MSSHDSGSLPANASLENLRKRAKTLLKEHAAGDAAARERVARVLPSAQGVLKLHEAQLVTAREHGMASWPKLVQELDARRPRRRVRREPGKVWLDGVPRLSWRASVEPTYVGALEAAFRGSDRPLELLSLMGDSGLCFRVRWAQREQGRAWCGSGPCGEWPEEVAALNRATGYVFEWNDPGISPSDTRDRVMASVDQGYPVLAMPSHLDVGVIYGYEDGGETLLVADYWASSHPERRAIADMQQIGCFLERIEEPLPRAAAVRAGLELALVRFRQGLVDPDPITSACYFYGSAGFERWAADLGRADELSEAQRQNLFFVNSWTYSGLHEGRTKFASDYLRRASRELGAESAAPLAEAAQLYDRVKDRMGRWDAADPMFGMMKQQPLSSWSPEIRAREIALLQDIAELEQRAMMAIERALQARA